MWRPVPSVSEVMRGRSTSACLVLWSSFSSSVNARSKMAATSPSGMQQVLRFAQLRVRFTGDGELDFVSFRGKRLDRGDVLPRLVKGRRNLATCCDLNRVRLGGEVWRLARHCGRRRCPLGDGSLRTDDTTAGCGRNAATITSTSRLLLCRAAASARS